MGLLINRAKAQCNAAGTGAVTPGSAVAPYQTWSAAGAASGYWYDYLIEQGNAWEIGVGLYNGTTISRPGPGVDPYFESSTGSLLSVTASDTIACVANRYTAGNGWQKIKTASLTSISNTNIAGFVPGFEHRIYFYNMSYAANSQPIFQMLDSTGTVDGGNVYDYQMWSRGTSTGGQVANAFYVFWGTGSMSNDSLDLIITGDAGIASNRQMEVASSLGASIGICGYRRAQVITGVRLTAQSQPITCNYTLYRRAC